MTDLQPVVCDTAEAMSRQAADLIVSLLREDPSLLLCAATGSTPTRTYELLLERYRAEPGLFDRMRVLKLDEWYELEMEHPGTCEAYLQRHLLGPLGIGAERYAGFDSRAPDSDAECARIRTWLADQGGIGLCILGIGRNGHLGLNEPGESLPPHAHLAELREETRRHPMLVDASERPRHGLTLGMAEILQSRRILLLVSGAGKREILARLLASPVTTALPASFLHLHPAVTLLCDREAARGN